jgi:hypothetical protein
VFQMERIDKRTDMDKNEDHLYVEEKVVIIIYEEN